MVNISLPSADSATDQSVAPRLGPFSLEAGAALAPVAGYTDWPFQLLCREYGCPLTLTPMIGAKALTHRGSREQTLKLLDWDDEHGPVAAQLYGDDPALMAQAARFLVEERGVQLVDINMGCTVPKIAGKGYGSALLGRPKLALKLVQAVRAAVGVPLTVKMRLGLHRGDGAGLELAQRWPDCGVSAVFLHGRYAEDGFGGSIDFAEVVRWVSRLRLPVIGNGDIVDEASAARWRRCGVSGIMLGRGALGAPWIFASAWDRQGGAAETDLELGAGVEERRQLARVILRHVALVRRYTRLDELQAVRQLRGHLVYYCRRQAALMPWREKLLAASDFATLEGLVQDLLI